MINIKDKVNIRACNVSAVTVTQYTDFLNFDFVYKYPERWFTDARLTYITHSAAGVDVFIVFMLSCVLTGLVIG